MASVTQMADWFLDRLAKFPTTQAVTAMGIAAFAGTIILWWTLALLHAVTKDWVGEWEPSVSMIGFISAWGVMAAAQFGVKRTTDADYAKAKAAVATTTTTTITPVPDPAIIKTETTAIPAAGTSPDILANRSSSEHPGTEPT